MRSNYIVIEGLEGAGKTTARDVVVETLRELGINDLLFTREPGGTVLAEKPVRGYVRRPYHPLLCYGRAGKAC